jgi:Ca-activated chloride channel family protein
MGRVIRAVVLGLLAAQELAAQAPEHAASRPAYRSGVNLVTLNVTVTDRAQRYVSNLDKQDFIVLEDGRPQAVTFFAHSGIPLTVAIVLDTSGSMDGALEAAHEAATGFIRRLAVGDRAAVIDFDTRVRVIQPFTIDLGALEKAVRSTIADGRTALYDALHLALQELEGLSYANVDTPRRHAIVLLSDGQDTSSKQQLDTVLDLANRSNTAIYAVGLGERDEGGRLATFEAESALRRLAIQTGGRAFFPTDMEQLHGIYSEIRRDLASQYTLAYASSNARRDGRWRNITVRLAQRDLDAHTRPGYYAPR